MAKGTRYTPEFKAKAVRLLTESRGSYPSEAKTVEQVARDPGGARRRRCAVGATRRTPVVYGYRKTHAQSLARGWDPAEIGRGRVMNVMRESAIRDVRRPCPSPPDRRGHGRRA